MEELKPIKLESTCVHLRHKMMYIDPRQSQVGKVDVLSDTAVHYCLKTQDALGPDDDAVAPLTCQPGRSCFCKAE